MVKIFKRRHFSRSISFALLVFLSISAPLLKGSQTARQKKEKLNVLLITIDTLRADRLSCYADSSSRTPNIDRLASQGTLFKKAFAHTSTTLPSHANILLGTTPLFHGVHENTNFIVRKELLTMAEVLKKEGYSTAAFVGAWPLESRFGLNQGFDIYDDDMTYSEKNIVHGGGQNNPSADELAWSILEGEKAERPAEAVINNSLGYLEAQNEPWFLWVHCFDPHHPYEPPEPYKTWFKDNPYNGEVAYTDYAMEILLDFLQVKGLKDNTIVIFTGDHGEAFGEHGEWTHGFFAYNTTLWIPLIFVVPGEKPSVVESNASHVDIFPTVLDILKIESPPFLQGQSLYPAIRGKKLANRLIYFESLSPFFSRGWAPIEGYIDQNSKFIDSPIPELFDLENDFDEMTNLASHTNLGSYQQVLSDIKNSQLSEDAVSARHRTDAQSLAKLRSLGYVSGSSTSQQDKYGPEKDVKTLLPYHNRTVEAMDFARTGRINESIALLQEVITVRPDMDLAYSNLAHLFQMQGRDGDALQVLHLGFERLPESYEIFSVYIRTLHSTAQFDQLIDLFDRNYLPQMDYDPEIWNSLGFAYFHTKDFEKALLAFNMALSIDNKYSISYNNLGSLYFAKYMESREQKDLQKSLDNFKKAIELDPRYASAHHGIGSAYLQSKDSREAIQFFESALKLQPDFHAALYGLGLAHFENGDHDKALFYFEILKARFNSSLSQAEMDQLEKMIRLCRGEEQDSI